MSERGLMDVNDIITRLVGFFLGLFALLGLLAYGLTNREVSETKICVICGHARAFHTFNEYASNSCAQCDAMKINKGWSPAHRFEKVKK